MKRLITLLLSTVVATAAFAGGPANVFVANINGTIYQQSGSGEDAKVVTSPLNAKRIFTEFGVSQNDYALVLNINSDDFLILVPKDAGSELPVITVLGISEAHALLNGKSGAGVFETPISNGPAGDTNLFGNLRGTMFGAIKVNPDTEKVQRFSASVTGSSTPGAVIKMDPAKGATPKGGSSASVLYKFKLSKGAPFTQSGTPGPL
jgi:hypothetical protein